MTVRTTHTGWGLVPFEQLPFEQLPYQTFEIVHDALSNYHHWVSAGSLLGIERENRFLPHEHDLDFGLIGNWDRVMPPEFTLVETIDDGDIQYGTAFRHEPTGIIVDIKSWQDNGDDRYATKRDDNTALYIPKVWVDKLNYKDFLGGKFPVPNNINAYLTYWYGDDWGVTKIGFHKQWES